MIEQYLRIDDVTMSLVREFARAVGCSEQVALKYLLKAGRYPQEIGEDDESYVSRLERLPDPDVVVLQGSQAANDVELPVTGSERAWRTANSSLTTGSAPTSKDAPASASKPNRSR